MELQSPAAANQRRPRACFRERQSGPGTSEGWTVIAKDAVPSPPKRVPSRCHVLSRRRFPPSATRDQIQKPVRPVGREGATDTVLAPGDQGGWGPKRRHEDAVLDWSVGSFRGRLVIVGLGLWRCVSFASREAERRNSPVERLAGCTLGSAREGQGEHLRRESAIGDVIRQRRHRSATDMGKRRPKIAATARISGRKPPRGGDRWSRVMCRAEPATYIDQWLAVGPGGAVPSQSPPASPEATIRAAR